MSWSAVDGAGTRCECISRATLMLLRKIDSMKSLVGFDEGDVAGMEKAVRLPPAPGC